MNPVFRWNLGRALRQILAFDVNRILFWDIGRAPIPPILLKAVAGFLLAGLVLAVVVPWAVRNELPRSPWLAWLVISTCVLGLIGRDLLRIVRRTRTRS